jgi:hypothetical protein
MSIARLRAVLDAFHARNGGRVMNLMPNDEDPSSAAAIHYVYGEQIQPPRRGRGAGTPSPGWCRRGGVGLRHSAQDGGRATGWWLEARLPLGGVGLIDRGWRTDAR